MNITNTSSRRTRDPQPPPTQRALAPATVAPPGPLAVSSGEEECDRQLLARVAEQDESALNAIHRRYVRRISRFLWPYLGNDQLVDEAINETLFVIWRKASEFDAARASVSTWLFGIAYYAGLRLRTRAVKESSTTQSDHTVLEEEARCTRPSQDPLAVTLGYELGEHLERALEQLSPPHREVAVLTLVEGHSYREIAKRLGCPENTVKTRLFHARRALAKRLEHLRQ